MEVKGHLLYYPEGKHDINLDNYVLKSQLNDALKSKVDSITKTTYANLKNLRDNSQLIPGSLYRITDYQCTTTQENTRSAGHQFDIVLLALSENKLAEEGWAMMHDNIYDVTFSDGVTKKCYLYLSYHEEGEEDEYDITDVSTLLGFNTLASLLIINDENKSVTFVDGAELPSTSMINNTTYNYFQNSNLSAWKVWYCLDNDTNRFAWADGGMIYINDYVYNRYPQSDSDDLYAWFNEDDGTVYTRSNCPKQGEIVYDTDKRPTSIVVSSFVSNGRGVIYRLIDEWNNDVPYDFKNIQHRSPINGDNLGVGTYTWFYTLSLKLMGNDTIEDFSVIQKRDKLDDSYCSCSNNYIGSRPTDIKNGFLLPEVILLALYNVDAATSLNFMRLFGCAILRTQGITDSTFISCSGFMNESGLVINNKKVLTES